MQDFIGRCSGPMGRRQALRILAGAGVGLATLAVFRSAQAEGEDIVYFSWEGYDAPELHPDFVAKHGKSPRSAIFASEDEALLKLRAGFEATLAHPSTYTIGRWVEAGAVQPIDVGRLKHYPDLWPELTQLKGAVEAGNTYLVPFDWGNSSIIYRTDKVKGEESWNLLFDERYAGKLAMYSDPEPCVVVAALALGFRNVFSLSDAELQQVQDRLKKQKELLRFYWDSQTSMEQALATGEVVAAYGWNSSYKTLKAAGHPVAYAQPKEGILTWVAGLVLLSNPVGPVDAAYDFIDAMLAPEVGKYLIEAWGYGHSNRKAFELADSAALESVGMRNPGELFSKGMFYEPVGQTTARRYIEAFQAATL